jgi:hypothetical protein
MNSPKEAVLRLITEAAATTRASMKRLIVTRSSAIGKRNASRCQHLASVLLQGRKSANIHASSGFIRGIPV